MNEQKLEEAHKTEVEDKIQHVLLSYLNVFEKEGVAAVRIPPPPPAATEAGTPPGSAAATEPNKGPGTVANEKDGDGTKNATETAVHRRTEEEPMDVEIGSGEVPIDMLKGNAPDVEGKSGGEGTAANTTDEKKDVAMTQKEEETPAEDIISYYASSKGKLKGIVVETIKAVKELNSAFQSFIIFVDTIKESEVLEY